MKPDKRLINTKVYVNGYNKETVKKLYELGFRWPTTDETIPYEIHPFLFMDCNGIITTSNRMDIFKKSKNREVSYAYILKLKPLIECDFKVFDKVLVRNDNHWVWMPKLFGKYLYNQKQCFLTIDGMRYSQCVHYEGNEHLAYTKDDPCENKEQTEDEQ